MRLQSRHMVNRIYDVDVDIIRRNDKEQPYIA
jgi:hypothetical protein